MFNTAIVDNRLSLAGGHGAGIYMDGNFLSPQLSHSTLSRNSGGDNTGVYIAGSGQPFFTNTLIYSHSIGLRTTGATPVMLLTLYDHNDTDTTGLVADFGPLKGDAKLAADGYHLQHGSAALEQG